MNIKNRLKAFTLAEIIITLTMMGVIAAIVIPSTIRNTTERTKKTKLRKALVSYDKAINNMLIENGLQRTSAALSDYAYKEADCANIRRYFKVTETAPGNSCQFRGTDGLWWDFGASGGAFDISRVRVAFEKKYMLGDAEITDPAGEATGTGFNAFILVTSFDSKGNLRINDVEYEKVSGTQATRQETQKVIAYLDGEYLDASGNFNMQQYFCIGDWCFIDDKIINIPNGSMCQNDLMSNGSWKTECVQGEAREICAQNGTDNSTTCGYCITDPNSFACRRGGYYCAQVDSTHMECHINGGMVSDIKYDKNGCVTYVRCNSWNNACRNGGSSQALKQCKTALCSYNGSEWVTDASDLEKEFFEEFINDWTSKTGGDSSLCGD